SHDKFSTSNTCSFRPLGSSRICTTVLRRLSSGQRVQAVARRFPSADKAIGPKKVPGGRMDFIRLPLTTSKKHNPFVGGAPRGDTEMTVLSSGVNVSDSTSPQARHR